MPFIDFSHIPDIGFAKYGLMLAKRFKIWSHKDLVYDKRAVASAILLFLVFSIFKFNIAFLKNLIKKKKHNTYFQSSSTYQNLLFG